MRSLVLAVVLSGVVSAAHAADLPDLPILRGGLTEGLSTSRVNWDGFYVGAQGGYGSSDESFSGSNQTMTARSALQYRHRKCLWRVELAASVWKDDGADQRLRSVCGLQLAMGRRRARRRNELHARQFRRRLNREQGAAVVLDAGRRLLSRRYVERVLLDIDLRHGHDSRPCRLRHGKLPALCVLRARIGGCRHHSVGHRERQLRADARQFEWLLRRYGDLLGRGMRQRLSTIV